MRSRIRTPGLVIALASLLALAASADDEVAQDFARPGAYAGASFDMGFDQFDAYSDADNGLGFGMWGGYRFLPYLAAEGQFEYLTHFGPKGTSLNEIDGRMTAVTANAKGYLPFGRFQPFALVGIGAGVSKFETLSEDESWNGFIARFGGGIDVYASENVVFEVASSYVLTTGDIDGLDWVSLVIGVQYRF